MALSRHWRKRPGGRPAGLAGGRSVLCRIALAASLTAVLAAGGLASTTERVVTDRFCGLAISGYDPLAFFIDGQARPGLSDFELRFAGAVWRFRNAGNRAAFAARPDIYAPRFGGYDPTGIARGVALAGTAAAWIVRDQRLYLFHDAEALEAFRSDPEPVIAAADARWPEVERLLSP